ncbi:host cell division inhibitory peptide Kil [Escherichia coli]
MAKFSKPLHIATFIGDEKMFREAVDAYKKWILILKLRSSKSIH